MLLMMSAEENCSLWDVCLVAQKSVGPFSYLLSLPLTSAFGSFTLSLPGDAVRRTGGHTSGAAGHCSSCWMVLEEMFLWKGELQRSSCHSFWFKLFESLMSVLSHVQERPLTSRMCVWSFTPVGQRALQSTNAPGKMAHGCPTSITVAPVRARITKSTGALFGLGRMSSRRSARMSSVTSPLSPGATWHSRRWRDVPAPITLTTAPCYRYVSRTKSVGWSESSLFSCWGWWLCAECGLRCGPYSCSEALAQISWDGQSKETLLKEKLNSWLYC